LAGSGATGAFASTVDPFQEGSMGERIGYIGPGLMGRGIVKNLRKRGHEVVVWAHRDGLDLSELTGAGARVTRSLEQAATQSSVAMLTVPSSKEVEAAVLGSPGLLSSMPSGSVVVDFSTSYPGSTRMLACKLKGRGIDLLDAPMTGTPVQAGSGELNLMVGGERAAYERCQPLFQAIAKNVFYVGPSGHGNIVKLVNNFLGQLTNAGLAEVLPLAAKAGVSLQALYDVVKVSGGYSRWFEGLVPAVGRREFPVTFHLKLAHKDMAYVSALGREMGMPLPMTNSLLSVMDIAKAQGLGDEDCKALVKLWERIGGVEVRAE
jgi:3-hydroxyisobutyrate dehydrogenase-like beta-hydroxyacid dehydrogenase